MSTHDRDSMAREVDRLDEFDVAYTAAINRYRESRFEADLNAVETLETAFEQWVRQMRAARTQDPLAGDLAEVQWWLATIQRERTRRRTSRRIGPR